MPEFRLGQFIAEGLVAGKAKQFALLHQIVLAGSGMGIMAFHATPLGYNLVNALGFGRNHWRMTNRADLFRIYRQKLAMAGCMRTVATGAFILLQRGVHELSGQFFLKGVVTFHAEVAERSRF